MQFFASPKHRPPSAAVWLRCTAAGPGLGAIRYRCGEATRAPFAPLAGCTTEQGWAPGCEKAGRQEGGRAHWWPTCHLRDDGFARILAHVEVDACRKLVKEPVPVGPAEEKLRVVLPVSKSNRSLPQRGLPSPMELDLRWCAAQRRMVHGCMQGRCQSRARAKEGSPPLKPAF